MDPNALFAQLVSAFNARRWPQVCQFADPLVAQNPDHAPVRYMAGIAHLELGRLTAALDHLQAAVRLAPREVDYSVHLAKLLAALRRPREARLAADHALALSPREPSALDTIGVVYSQLGAYPEAVKAFGRAAELAPASASHRYNLATALIAAGDLVEAEQAIEACVTLDERYWRAHLTLAQLRRQTPANNHIARLHGLLDTPGTESDTPAQVCLNMALAKEYEDTGDFANAFHHLVRGKSAAGTGRTYSIAQDEALFSAIVEHGSDPVLPAAGHPSEEPIFVIGMPRSGTTLVERILSSHPDVYSAGELLNFPLLLKEASGSGTPALIDIDTISRARRLGWARLGEVYVGSTRPATGHAPRFIDKLPHNFLYVGFILKALPNAKIICLRRHPMDTCLSNFRQLFAPKSPYFDYSFDLRDIGRYFVLFDKLMAHWQQTFPGRILQVHYESLVEDQEASSRQMLDFCGLDWHPDCLRFEDNPAPVATASAVQVRAPIYRNALARWKRYGPDMDELATLLRDAGIAVD